MTIPPACKIARALLLQRCCVERLRPGGTDVKDFEGLRHACSRLPSKAAGCSQDAEPYHALPEAQGECRIDLRDWRAMYYGSSEGIYFLPSGILYSIFLLFGTITRSCCNLAIMFLASAVGRMVSGPRTGDWLTGIAMKQSRREFLVIAGAAVAAGALPLPVIASAKMKIGIVGSGNVGSAIGATWVRAGHEVMFSSLNIEHDKALAARLGCGARAGTPREAAVFGEVVMISVPYHALPSVGKDLADLLKGKIVIDTNNPFLQRDGEIAKWAREKRAGLASRALLPGARIVRAFNVISAARMGSAYQEPGRVGYADRE